MKLTITNARPVDCSMAFPPTALSARVRIFDIAPATSAVLLYTPKTGDNPVRFNGPETTAEVPVEGHEMYAQPVLGNTTYRVEFLGYRDDLTR
jgi:hypothetical protein